VTVSGAREVVSCRARVTTEQPQARREEIRATNVLSQPRIKCGQRRATRKRWRVQRAPRNDSRAAKCVDLRYECSVRRARKRAPPLRLWAAFACGSAVSTRTPHQCAGISLSSETPQTDGCVVCISAVPQAVQHNQLAITT